ncbi:MAG: flagellar FliJ family protein [SAR324 cluster bacterium]|jgi:flagellar FliJ protein|nr:flagellar FliJ family protein [SAR324 cluster bacterium]MCH2265498.1 flagellar FliJ family protein [SAR324 cluster bacterium]|tara:strand:+ start:163 stop:603 length:441 start_codon:yes stop_codon:yes gene_type:complete
MPRFSLETALKVRERLEKLYQKALAEQVQLEQQHRNRKKLMQDALEIHNNDLDKAKTDGVTLNQLLMGGHFQQRIKQHLELTQDQLNEQLEVVELKRHELTQATQKKRVLEILKEKEIQKFKDETERLERLEADEIAQNYRRYTQN